jgi:hypothetical protein
LFQPLPSLPHTSTCTPNPQPQPNNCSPTPPHPPTPRRKDLKNPRKKHRIKYASAQVRRKGQVQGVREAEGVGYAGEATGVKANITKSRRLG